MSFMSVLVVEEKYVSCCRNPFSSSRFKKDFHNWNLVGISTTIPCMHTGDSSASQTTESLLPPGFLQLLGRESQRGDGKGSGVARDGCGQELHHGKHLLRLRPRPI